MFCCAGVSAANLMEAACELQALLQRRAACGLGPLLRAQPFFPVSDTAAASNLEPLPCPPQGLLFGPQSASKHGPGSKEVCVDIHMWEMASLGVG